MFRLSVILIITSFGMLWGQVGIGTLNPQAQLDVRASNAGTPANSDGILIPKMDAFPLTNPTVNQDGMLIYISGMGVVTRGFYYWDQATTSWISLLTSLMDDNDWVASGADIERSSGDVYIGANNGTNNDLYLSNRLIDWDNSNYLLDLTSDDSKINELEFDDGTAADPSIRFDDATTGFFSPATDITAYSINSSERLRIDANGRLGVGTNNPQYTVEVSGSIFMEDSSFPGSTAGHSGLYSNSGELTAVDAIGNQTVLSPHHFSLIPASEPMAWSFYSRNQARGLQINVDMLQMVRLVEQLSGVQLVYLADLDGNPMESQLPISSLVAQMKRLFQQNKHLQQQLKIQQGRLKSVEEILEKL